MFKTNKSLLDCTNKRTADVNNHKKQDLRLEISNYSVFKIKFNVALYQRQHAQLAIVLQAFCVIKRSCLPDQCLTREKQPLVY